MAACIGATVLRDVARWSTTPLKLQSIAPPRQIQTGGCLWGTGMTKPTRSSKRLGASSKAMEVDLVFSLYVDAMAWCRKPYLPKIAALSKATLLLQNAIPKAEGGLAKTTHGRLRMLSANASRKFENWHSPDGKLHHQNPAPYWSGVPIANRQFLLCRTSLPWAGAGGAHQRLTTARSWWAARATDVSNQDRSLCI